MLKVNQGIVAAVLLAGVAPAMAAPIFGNAVAAFDPAGGQNRAVNSGVVSNEPGMTLATWQSRVSAAHAAAAGGVWNATTVAPGAAYDDNVAGFSVIASGTPMTLTVAPGRTIGITGIDTFANELRVAQFGSADAISGYGVISDSGGGSDATWGMSFALAGFPAGSLLTELGMANVGRSGAVGSALTITVTFTDNTTATTGGLTPLGQGNARLVHFVAPAGKGISKVDMVINGTRGIQLDDVSFVVTVPEPTSAAAVVAALGGLALRRRR